MDMIDQSHDLRGALARAALAEVPRLLTLMDRTPVSATYGCCDRDYWHTRVMDFPSGMYQAAVLPLALVWSLDLPDNPYRGQPAIRDWVEAGIRYAARSAHPDGSCDDYYPFERAAGAAAFSLRAALEASEIIGLVGDPEVDAFLKTRAKWLAEHEESGRLSNHEALITVCLQRMAARFGGEWEAAMRKRLARLLSWQSSEGWFDEYGGADPGYLTLTIAELAELDRSRPDLGVHAPLERAIGWYAKLVHPDGTAGGEYASRATPNYFSHGFEIAGAWSETARAINDRCLRPLATGRQPAFSERFAFHHVTGWLLAWRHWQPQRPGPLPLESGRLQFDAAKLLVDARADQRLYLGWSRGGAFRLYAGDTLLHADTGVALRMDGGKVAVMHLEGDNQVELGKDRVDIRGRMAFAKSARLSPVKSIILRSMMLTLGRFFPDLVRRMLQRLLVTGRNEAPFAFHRTLEWRGDHWHLRDEITADKDWFSVECAGMGGHQSSLTTVVSRLWQRDQLQPWVDLTDRIPADRKAPLVVEQTLKDVQSA